MNEKQFRILRACIAGFIAFTVSIAVTLENIILAFAGVIIGMVFLFLVRKKTKVVLYDERIKIIAGAAARLTYAITTVTFAFLSLGFLMSTQRLAGDPYVESLGTIFSYIALYNMAIYAICFHYFRSKQS